MNRFWTVLLVSALAFPAVAQQRQPAQVTTLPASNPQEFDLLDASGVWVPFGTINPATHAFKGFGTGIDVRAYGCVADGVTDQTACINNALANATDCVIIPATSLGFYVAGTLTVPRCLRGTTWNPSSASGDFSNASRIVCNNQAAQPCVIVNRAATSATQIENISLIGSGPTPAAGAIGFQWQNGYNLILTNFQSTNFDTCAYFGPSPTTQSGPIAAHMVNVMLSRCQKHYAVSDSVAELYFTGGRWGENGGGDFNADDFLYATKTTSSLPGGGPNTIVVDSVQINPGGKTVGCAFRWGGFAGTGGLFGANKIINSHVEILDTGYAGSASQGMICVDNTVPSIPGMMVSNNTFATDGGATLHPLLNVDSTRPWTDFVSFSDNDMAVAAFSLTVNGVTASRGPKFVNNFLPGGSSFIAGDSSASLVLTNNVLGAHTVSGQWASLYLTQNFGVITDNATGTVRASGTNTTAWTPALFSGTATFTYSTQTGQWWRTADGGLAAYFSIALSAASGLGASGVSITGLPKSCNRPSANVLQVYNGFTGLNGVPWASWVNGGSSIALVQQGSGLVGDIGLVGTNLTNTTNLVGTVTCGQAL